MQVLHQTPCFQIRKSLLLTFATFCFLILPHLAGAFPDWLSRDDRQWIIDASTTDPATSQAIHALPAGDGLQIAFDVEESQLVNIYALRLETQSKLVPKIQINGVPLDIHPVRGDDGGLYYRLAGSKLTVGENTIEVLTPGVVSSGLNIEAFSLVDAYEEVHFRRVVAPSAAIRVQPPADPSQLQFDVEHYDLEMVLNMSSTIIDATLTMTATSLSDTLQTLALDFNSNGNHLNAAWVDQGPSTSTLSYTQNTSSNRLFITLPAAVPEGNIFTVRVKYGGIPDPYKIFSAAYIVETHGSGTPVLYTFSEPYGARDWWPCKDIPEDKATMDLHLTCPTAYTPVSNGLLDSVVNNGDGTHTYNWRETHPMATYLASICCTNYQVASSTYTSQDGMTTMEVSHYLYPEYYAQESSGVTATVNIIGFLSETFGEYPFLNEKYVTASHNDSAGMEHQTCTSLPGGDLIDYTYGTGYGRRNVHELAHMWFGDLITMEHFDHLWLNEGFATYCEALFYEDRYGKDYYHSYVNNWSVSDSYPLVSSSADNFSGSIVYRKGAWVLHMLRNVVGDEDFFQSIRNYVANPDFRYGTALSIDLQNEFEAQSGEDLDYFFNQWLYRTGRPTYRWSWSSHINGASHILDLVIQQTQSVAAFTMPIDLVVTDTSAQEHTIRVFNNQKIQSFQVDLGSVEPATVQFDPDNWILKSSAVMDNSMPSIPLLSVLGVSGRNDAVEIRWTPTSDTDCIGYEVHKTTDYASWTTVATTDTLNAGSSSCTIEGLTPDQACYFAVRAIGQVKAAGPLSDIYGCAPSLSPQALIVDGYDRWDTQSGRGGSFPGAWYHGDALIEAGITFETCDNDEVGSTVSLGDYAVVIYVLGEESTSDETFSTSEQQLVQNYLSVGGNLFVSGAEIGWDLDNRGDSADQAFYHNYLKAIYAGDDAGTTQCSGTTGSIFAGVGAFQFGIGSGDSYAIDYADRLGTTGGSQACLTYIGGTADTAAIQYANGFRVINIGFAFETIVEQSAREAIMSAAMEFFGLSSGIPSWTVY